MKVTSFWRFNLGHELAALLLASLALGAGTWFSVDQLDRRYLRLHREDAQRVGALLEEHLADARLQLDRFAALPPELQRSSTPLLLPAFSDVYRLGGALQVQQVLAATSGSRVFPGFSFANSRIRAYLEQDAAGRAVSSVITRGLEDEIASVYVASGDPARELWLGRVNLAYLNAFLRRYSQGSGVPLLLVSHDGFVMLASDPEMGVPAVDLSLATARRHTPYRLRYQQRDWLPVVATDNGLGGHIVTLIPADQLAFQRRQVILPILAVLALMLVVFFWKNRRLHQLLFEPVGRFTARLDQLRSALADPQLRPLRPMPVVSRFREMSQIQAGFEELLAVIAERDLALQQKLRTSLTAAAIAHEINLPLSTIRLRCQQADQQLRLGGFSPEQTRELVRDLQTESQQVSRVIERMRMLLRNVQTDLVPTDLASVVNGAITLHKRLLREQGVQLERHGLEHSRLIVMADAAQLQMAIGNLLRNAIEAQEALPPAERRVRVSLRRRGDQAQLLVADAGPGFDLDPEADTLLCSTKPGGTGLGLFVVRTTLINHQGRLSIRRSSSLGGAAVCLELPLSASSENYSELPMVPAAQSAYGLQR